MKPHETPLKPSPKGTPTSRSPTAQDQGANPAAKERRRSRQCQKHWSQRSQPRVSHLLNSVGVSGLGLWVEGFGIRALGLGL